jgi:hypothetical protein
VAILTQEVERLEQQIVRLRQQQQEEQLAGGRANSIGQQQQERDVKESREYQMLLRDLQLLLSHRDEISDMKQLVLKLQQNV